MYRRNAKGPSCSALRPRGSCGEPVSGLIESGSSEVQPVSRRIGRVRVLVAVLCDCAERWEKRKINYTSSPIFKPSTLSRSATDIRDFNRYSSPAENLSLSLSLFQSVGQATAGSSAEARLK